jgi:hypothetical protein
MSRYYPAVIRKSFWFDKTWPRDAPDGSYVFLGNAVLAVGRAIFGADWSDKDPQAAFSHKGSVVAERARVTDVMERLGVAVARGEVGFALRAEKGGDFKPQKEAVDARTSALIAFSRANCNVDDFTPLFKFAQMNDGKYRVEQTPPLDWIYVERRTFERFIAGLAPDSYGLPVLNDFRDERRELIEAVESGRLFHAEAEDIAAGKGLFPLHYQPEPDEFPVMEQLDWTIEMVVAWIIWRDPTEVVKFYGPYHDLWVTPRNPFDATPERTLQGVEEVCATSEKTPFLSYDDAMKDLMGLLRDGIVSADAVNSSTMKATIIEALEWKRLVLSTHGQATRFSHQTNVYEDIRFDRQRVVNLWPAGSNLDDETARGISTNIPKRASASLTKIRKAVEASLIFFPRNGFRPWTRTEAEEQLRSMLGATRAQWLEILKKYENEPHFPPKRGRRGSTNASRDEELRQFRDFFLSGDMGN